MPPAPAGTGRRLAAEAGAAAAELFKEIGFNEAGPLILMVPPDDARMDAAYWIAEELGAGAVEVEIVEAVPGDAREKMILMLEAGQTVLWLGQY